jgi:queuine tRNA-ribosyltransferase subunit QTRTD1
MVPGCSCWACQHHSRAYVHHLLLTREMLGSVLLEMHNTHWWLQFFGAMRAAIEAGRWKSWAAWWGDRQLRAWPEQ